MSTHILELRLMIGCTSGHGVHWKT